MTDDKLELGALAQAYALGYLDTWHGREMTGDEQLPIQEMLEPLVAGLDFARLNADTLAEMDLANQAKACHDAGADVAREQKAQLN